MRVCVTGPKSDQAMEVVGGLAEAESALALVVVSMLRVASRLWVRVWVGVGRGRDRRERTGGVRVVEGVVSEGPGVEAVSGRGGRDRVGDAIFTVVMILLGLND